MTLLDDVLYLMKKNKWIDDIDFINTSHEYVCIKDLNDIFNKGDKVLIKIDNDSIIATFIKKNKSDIDVIKLEFEGNENINDYFKRTRLIKIEEILKNGKME